MKLENLHTLPFYCFIVFLVDTSLFTHCHGFFGDTREELSTNVFAPIIIHCKLRQSISRRLKTYTADLLNSSLYTVSVCLISSAMLAK